MTDLPPPPPPPPGMTPPPPPGMTPPPMPGYGGSEEKNSLGVWALVLGILSLVCCGLLAGIPAIIVGRRSKEAGEQGLATNANLGNVGFILGIIGTILSAIGVVFYIVLIIAGTAGSSTSGF